jgi:hypothetical protein
MEKQKNDFFLQASFPLKLSLAHLYAPTTYYLIHESTTCVCKEDTCEDENMPHVSKNNYDTQNINLLAKLFHIAWVGS